MTRREEAIQKAALTDWEHAYFISWDEATDEEKAAWLESTANVITAYEAHMRPEVASVEDAENLPNGTIVQDDMDLLLRVDGEWRVVEYQDSRAYPITPARVIHWGAE